MASSLEKQSSLNLVAQTRMDPPCHEIGAPMLLSNYVMATYRCYTPFWPAKEVLSQQRGSAMAGLSHFTRVSPGYRATGWALIWGGAKRMGGGKRTRERAPPKIFGPLQKSFWSALSWISVQEKQSTDT